MTCGALNNDDLRLVATRGTASFQHDFDCQQLTSERYTDPMPSGTDDVMVSRESPEGRLGETRLSGL